MSQPSINRKLTGRNSIEKLLTSKGAAQIKSTDFSSKQNIFKRNMSSLQSRSIRGMQSQVKAVEMQKL